MSYGDFLEKISRDSRYVNGTVIAIATRGPKAGLSPALSIHNQRTNRRPRERSRAGNRLPRWTQTAKRKCSRSSMRLQSASIRQLAPICASLHMLGR